MHRHWKLLQKSFCLVLPKKKCSHESLDKAEEYLVTVSHPSTKCKTFDDLRYVLQSQHRLSERPPSSFYVRNGHLKRCFFILRECFRLSGEYRYSAEEAVKLTDFGWYKTSTSILKPQLCLNMMPSKLLVQCTCTTCVTSRCKCHIQFVACKEY